MKASTLLKRLVAIAAVGLILLFGGVTVFGGSLLRAAVENGTAWALDVPVSVGSGSLSLLGGSAGVSAMEIGNPPGFKTKNCFSVGHVQIGASPTSLLSDTIVVNEITIDRPEVTIELVGTGTNLGALMANLDRKVGNAPPEKPKEQGPASKNMFVKEVLITGPMLRLAAGGTTTAIPIADIHLSDIGGGPTQSRIEYPQLLKRIIGEIAARAATAAASQLPKAVAEALKREGEQAIEQVRGSIANMDQTLQKAIGDASSGGDLKKSADALKKGVESMGKELEGVFKKK